MKAVLGFLFVLSGLIVGYGVLSGKILPSIPTPGSTSTTSSNNNNPVVVPTRPGAGNIRGGGPGSTALGFPAFVYGLDMPASRGGMQ